MTGPDAEFQKRILATFREEAEEHVSEITGDLIALEKAGVTGGTPLTERIYRRIHSLKGAARAVDQQEIGLVCQHLESVFSAIKKGTFTPDAETFDIFHNAIKTLTSLIAGDPSPVPPVSGLVRSLRALDASRMGEGSSRLLDLTVKLPPVHPVETRASTLKPGIPEHDKSAVPGSEEFRKPAPAGDSRVRGGTPFPPPRENGTVRIAAGKLDRLIAGSDNLLTTRLFITHRMQKLEEMMGRFTLWRWNFALVSSDLHRIRETSFGSQKSDLPPELVLPLQRIVEFLEYDREFVAYLQHDLGAHIRETEIDRSALAASTSAISDLIHNAVLLPVSSVLTPFSGLVREFSRKSGKEIDFQVDGGDIEMDRRILEALKDPLMHIINNSIDHGIEPPAVRVAADKPARGTVQVRIDLLSGSKVRIEISDDGAGIDRSLIRKIALEKGIIGSEKSATLTDDEVIWLIFRSGISTNPLITDISGRGLGLAIVEDSVTRLGGSVTVSSKFGKGTSIHIIVPVRLATMRGVVVRAGNQAYVLPMQQVAQVIRLTPGAVRMEGERPVIRIQDKTIGVIRLTEALGISHYAVPSGKNKAMPVVILSYGAGQIACIVDEVVRVQEIVARSLGSQLRRVKRITGAVILGDGNVALVLDPLELIQESLKGHIPHPQKRTTVSAPQRILIVEDSVTSRALLEAVLERAGYRTMTAVDGMEAFAILKENDFDMVVSDVDMPRMNGFTLTEKIRTDPRLEKLPVVLVTSLDSPEDQKHGAAVGADAYIVKSSFSSTVLLDSIRALMARNGA